MYVTGAVEAVELLVNVTDPDAPPLLVVPPVTGVGDPPQIATYIIGMHSSLDGS
jgi:hypothetical protein